MIAAPLPAIYSPPDRPTQDMTGLLAKLRTLPCRLGGAQACSTGNLEWRLLLYRVQPMWSRHGSFAIRRMARANRFSGRLVFGPRLRHLRPAPSAMETDAILRTDAPRHIGQSTRAKFAKPSPFDFDDFGCL